MKVSSAMAVIERMKEIALCKTDTKLANMLGVSSSAINGWKIRNEIPGDYIVKISEKYNKSVRYILYGEQNNEEGPELQKLFEILKESPEDTRYIIQILEGRKSIKEALMYFGEEIIEAEDCSRLLKKP